MSGLRIGGRVFEIPVPNFKTLKKLWPLVQEVQKATNSEDPIEILSATVEILSVAMLPSNPELTVDFFEENLTPDELQLLPGSLKELLTKGGLNPAVGERSPREGNSTETSTE